MHVRTYRCTCTCTHVLGQVSTVQIVVQPQVEVAHEPCDGHQQPHEPPPAHTRVLHIHHRLMVDEVEKAACPENQGGLGSVLMQVCGDLDGTVVAAHDQHPFPLKGGPGRVMGGVKVLPFIELDIVNARKERHFDHTSSLSINTCVHECQMVRSFVPLGICM